MLCVALGCDGWQNKRGAGNFGIASIVAQREAELIGVGEGVAEVSRKGAVEEGVIGTLTLGLEIGCRTGVIEFPQETAEIGATARGGETPAFGIKVGRRDARFASMGKELDNAGNSVAAIDRAFGTAHNFNFVDIFRGETGEIHGTPGGIDGRAVHKNLGEIGVAAVQEERRGAAKGAGMAKGSAG